MISFGVPEMTDPLSSNIPTISSRHLYVAALFWLNACRVLNIAGLPATLTFMAVGPQEGVPLSQGSWYQNPTRMVNGCLFP
jgi:hypothetical protein